MKALELEPPPPRRLIHYTPLRYPGGKGKLAAFIKQILKENKLLDGHYAEPYAGGAAIGLELLFHDYVSQIYINDLSRPVHAFWNSVLNHTDALCRKIRDIPLNIESWDRQKRIFGSTEPDDVELGFATFFLNRTNRSGILNGGIIGGRNQTGAWKIDARFNREDLIFRVMSIAKLHRRIRITQMDALAFLHAGLSEWPTKTLIYLDPPYYAKGRDLYYDFYTHGDHEQLARFVTSKLVRQRWVVSYDNLADVRALYRGCQRITYGLGYSAREARQGSEVMFFSDSLRVPPLVGPFKLIRGSMIKKNVDVYGGSLAQPRARAAGHRMLKGTSAAKKEDRRGRKKTD